MKLSTFLIRSSLLGLGVLLGSQQLVRADGLSAAAQLAAAAAPQLALLQLDQGIAQAPAATRPDWERQQWQLLASIGQPDEILKRAAVLPEDAPQEVKHIAALLAARAAIAKGDGGLARGYLAQLLWVVPGDQAEYRELRTLAVQSHLLPQPDAEAGSVMLRFQQDFGADVPLLRQYALAMLQAGRATELNWARAQLAPSDALAALIDAHSTQLADTEVKQRLQTVLDSDASAPMLLLVQKLAVPLNAPELQILISEHLLNQAAAPAAAEAPALWKAYRSLTQSFGNVRLLLFGSDAGWAELARESLAAEPVMARAIWSYLARDAKDPVLRSAAQQQLLEQLSGQRLERAALRLFETAWPGLPAAKFNPVVRYRLGQIALDVGKFELAAGLWRDLEVLPDGVDGADWQLRRAVLFARQQDWTAAAHAVSAWLSQVTSATPAAGWQMLAVLQQLSQQTQQAASAQDLLARLLPVVEPLQRRVALQQLGQLADAAQQPLLAAQWYLQAATQLPQADAFAWQAHLDAAASLDRAGLHDDATRQYGLVAHASTDAAQQAAAHYALSSR